MNINIILDGITLPMPDVPFLNPVEPNETDVVTLDGSLYSDFTNRRNSWQLQWARLTKAEYDQIEQIRNDQMTNEAYPLLQIDYYNVAVPVKVILNDKDIRNDGVCIYNVEMILLEQFSVS